MLDLVFVFRSYGNGHIAAFEADRKKKHKFDIYALSKGFSRSVLWAFLLEEVKDYVWQAYIALIFQHQVKHNAQTLKVIHIGI